MAIVMKAQIMDCKANADEMWFTLEEHSGMFRPTGVVRITFDHRSWKDLEKHAHWTREKFTSYVLGKKVEIKILA